MQNQPQFVMEPPLYFAQDHIFDIDFHPSQSFITTAEVTGLVSILKYSSDDVTPVAQFSHHQQSARVSQFFPDGQFLLTASVDKSVCILDANGKMLRRMDNAHKDAIYICKVIGDNIVVSGDDSGCLKIWDLRQNNCVYKVNEVQEAITAIEIDSSQNLLLTSSLDGYLCVHDLRLKSTNDKCLYAKSDCMEEDLSGLCIMKNGRFVAVSTSEGNILLFKWDYFGDFKDRVIGHPNSIDTMLKVDEHSLLTGGEDGLLRGVSVFPNNIVGVLGQHEEDKFYPISKIAMDPTKQIAASISHDSAIKFHDISEFVHARKSAKVMNDENEFQYCNGRENMKKQFMEQEEDDDDDNDFESDSDDEDNNKKKKTKKNRTKSVDQSVQQLKKQKIQRFFDKM